MKKSQETTLYNFHYETGQKSDGRLQIIFSIQRSIHKEPPEVGLVSLYWWVELCMPTLRRECGDNSKTIY